MDKVNVSESQLNTLKVLKNLFYNDKYKRLFVKNNSIFNPELLKQDVQHVIHNDNVIREFRHFGAMVQTKENPNLHFKNYIDFL